MNSPITALIVVTLLWSAIGSAQDSFEPDNAFDQATFDVLSTHTFHQPQDEDWFAFYLPQGQTLHITPRVGIAVNGNNVGTGIAGEIYLRGSDGRALFESVVFARTDGQEFFGFGSYVAPVDGFFYLRVSPCTVLVNPNCGGLGFPAAGAEYTIELPFTFTGSNGTGRLAGTITDAQTGQAVAFATVATSGNTGTFSRGTGAYTLVDAIGNYTVTVSAPGYRPQTSAFELTEFNTTTVNLALSPNLAFFADSFEAFVP
ncbi:MAG: carboxypeptidase-like regulatory domain-containing protein [Lysobacterales bacterium]